MALVSSAVETLNRYNGLLTALASLVVAWFTIVLARVGREQSNNTKILERAYLSVEPGGIVPTTGGRGPNCIANIDIKNAGRLPARNIRWSIQHSLDEDHRRPAEKLKVTKEPEGDNVLVPGGKMTQGGREIINVGQGENELKPKIGLYLYVWGVVYYDNGFGEPRTTYFCHRYNCINLRNVDHGKAKSKGFRFDERARIGDRHGRHHRIGNSAT